MKWRKWREKTTLLTEQNTVQTQPMLCCLWFLLFTPLSFELVVPFSRFSVSLSLSRKIGGFVLFFHIKGCKYVLSIFTSCNFQIVQFYFSPNSSLFYCFTIVYIWKRGEWYRLSLFISLLVFLLFYLVSLFFDFFDFCKLNTQLTNELTNHRIK